jgi:hypothetical protein
MRTFELWSGDREASLINIDERCIIYRRKVQEDANLALSYQMPAKWRGSRF